MDGRFAYLLDKIEAAPFQEEPFRHLEIGDFLSPPDFAEITTHPQIRFEPAERTTRLFEMLAEHGYEAQSFPGSVTSPKTYLKWQEGKSRRRLRETTAGFGMVFRLTRFDDDLLGQLNRFFQSKPFLDTLRKRFAIERPVSVDAGLQKYLHGYEISPHPDTRQKALTWMLNVNPGEGSEDIDFHTHYLTFRQEWAFIREFWRGHPELDRDWLFWDWCETVKRQRANNSIVLFAPGDDTLHAVKADYDHLRFQRTQFYGNLWYPGGGPPLLPSRHFRLAEQACTGFGWRERLINRVRSTSAYAALKRSRIGDAVRGRRGRGAGR